MKKIFAYIIVNIFTWNPDKSLSIVKEFLCDQPSSPSNVKPILSGSTKNIVKPAQNKNKKDELMENLDYLKSKKNKTKQDKDSIYTLEMVLKNMS